MFGYNITLFRKNIWIHGLVVASLTLNVFTFTIEMFLFLYFHCLNIYQINVVVAFFTLVTLEFHFYLKIKTLNRYSYSKITQYTVHTYSMLKYINETKIPTRKLNELYKEQRMATAKGEKNLK